MTWFYLDNGAQKGPISDNDLQALVANGTINDATSVWREGMAAWQPYGEIRSSGGGSAAQAEPAPTVPGGVTCSECGRVFPPSEIIRHGSANICANCKPAFVQKLKEGIAPKGVLNYAGFGVRGGSVILDAIIMWIVTIGPNILIIHMLGKGTTTAAINFLWNIAIAISYYVFFLGKYGATPGKMANKLQVVNADGSKITYGKAFGRYWAANWLSGVFTLCIGYLIAIWDDEKRALHDRICGTRVIRRQVP